MGALRGTPSVIKNPDGTETPTQQGGFVGASGGGMPGIIKAVTGATGGMLGGGGKASMRFAGDALDSKKEDVKSQEESKLTPTPIVKPEEKYGTSDFSGSSLSEMIEKMKNREMETYDRSLASLPKPLQMMFKRG